MTVRLAVLSLAGIVLPAGCTTYPLTVGGTVGPQAVSPDGRGEGNLIVYTARRVSGYTGSEFPVYSPYRLYAKDSVVAREVQNRAGSFDQDPVRLTLAPGEYRVSGLAEGGGEVTAPVRIEAGRVTVVDLAQRGAAPPR